MITITNGLVTSDSGLYVRRISNGAISTSHCALPQDTVESFEEIAEIPAYTKAEYDAKVAQMVRQRYSESEEFAIQRKAINAAFSPSTTNNDSVSKDMEEYAAYNAYVEECKARAPEAIAEDKAQDTDTEVDSPTDSEENEVLLD